MSIELDEMSLLFGEDFVINDKLKIRHPTIREIKDFGEKEYINIIHLFCLKPYDLMVELDDAGIDFAEISNFDIFMMLYQSEHYFKGLNWLLSRDGKSYFFIKGYNENSQEFVLYDPDSGIVIDKYIYEKISKFIRTINYISDKTEYNPAKKSTRKFLIEQKREERQLKKNKEEFRSMLTPLISALVWNSNSKYTFESLLDLKMYQLQDGIMRINKIEDFRGKLTGINTGNIDTSKLNFANINWAANYNSTE